MDLSPRRPARPDRPVDATTADDVIQASFAGVWLPDGRGGWKQTVPGTTGPEKRIRRQRWYDREVGGPRRRRRSRRRVASGETVSRGRVRFAAASTAVLVAAGTSLMALPTAERVGDQLRRAPAPLLDGPVDTTDSGAEALYKAAAPSVVTVLASAGSSGTAFVYRPGMLLTNWHVVAGDAASAARIATGERLEVDIVDASGRERTGVVRAGDSRLDLALIDVDGLDDLPPLPLGDPDALDVGQPVFVLGSPFGIPGTMTRGMVTGVSVNTGFAQTSVQTGLLMTDAAANPGNSGGPVLTANGTVVGVVTLRPDEAGGRSVQGLTFALPADVVAWSAAWLERGQAPGYGMIGIAGRTASPDVGIAGVLVETVSDGLPAVDAGVEPGDVITGAAGAAVTTFDDLVDALRTVDVGRELELQLHRPDETGGRDVTVTLTVAERPDDA